VAVIGDFRSRVGRGPGSAIATTWNGDFVLCGRCPFWAGPHVTYGIISAKGRRNLELDDSGIKLQDFLQTDAGSIRATRRPLVNLRGSDWNQTPALPAVRAGTKGLGSLPINMFRAGRRQLIEHGKRRVRSWGDVGLQFRAVAPPIWGASTRRRAVS